ncbi:hypothetical protein AU189_11490 [Mycolicibacterium acapulense]|nr:hypothetical protein AU189_11490 [Mycolicibacterium acapulense]
MPQRNSTSRKVGVNEAARITGLHRCTIRRYIAEGRLTAYRVGPKLIKINVDDLEALARPVGGAA